MAVLELVTGQPPYFDFNPITAMYRICSDDHPPLPPSQPPHK